jgi:peptidoglycan/LPS O-acetylase OafA/YrhL
MRQSEIRNRNLDKATTVPEIHHKPQLDALRAMAVCAVLIHHFLPVQRLISENFLTLGLLAVRLFFVLSGYLITGILLRSRSLSFRAALREFYTRRALRILPIYYLTLLVAALLGVTAVSQFIFWHSFYVSNILFILKPAVAGPIGHLWTLSVEEQFYIAWPFLVLLTPYRHIAKMIAATVSLGIVWKTIVAFTLGPDMAGGILAPACFDSLGIGALLAFIENDKKLRPQRNKLLHSALIAGIVIVLLQTSLYVAGRGLRFFWSTSYLGVSLVFVWLVGRAAQGFKGKLGAILEWAPITYVGKISYGIYLYHFFMPDIVRYLARSLSLSPPHTLLTFFLASALTLTTAIISWHLIERPINQWKERLSFSTRQTHE